MQPTPTTAWTIAAVLRESGLSMAQLSRRFGIPYRTVQNWTATGETARTCPAYVPRMMAECLGLEDAPPEEKK